HLLRRSDRSDLGVWRLASKPGATPERILAPASSEPRLRQLGTIWSTALALDANGRRLAVVSCGPENCLARVIGLASPRVILVAGAALGDLIACDGDRLVGWAPCHGFPCPILSVNVGDGSRAVLAADATGAAIVAGGSLRIAISIVGGGVVITDP